MNDTRRLIFQFIYDIYVTGLLSPDFFLFKNQFNPSLKTTENWGEQFKPIVFFYEKIAVGVFHFPKIFNCEVKLINYSEFKQLRTSVQCLRNSFVSMIEQS